MNNNKTYDIQLSISGSSSTLDFIYKVMSVEEYPNDLINDSMDIFKEIFKVDNPRISTWMKSGVCKITYIRHLGSTIVIDLRSTAPIPFGWLHGFAYAFNDAVFTVYTTDEGGNEMILLY